MTRTRMVVAFVEVESPNMRQWALATGSVDADDLVQRATHPPRVTRDDGTERRDEGRWWCAACASERDLLGAQDVSFRVSGVYRTDKTVPEVARCEVCSIGIRDLQEMMTRAVS